MKTAIQKLMPILLKLIKKKALDRNTLAKRIKKHPNMVSWALCDGHKKKKLFRHSKNPYLWYGIKEPEAEREPELRFKEITEDKLIKCAARGENIEIMLSVCVFNELHPECEMCEEGLK